jgi:hypothetical protein
MTALSGSTIEYLLGRLSVRCWSLLTTYHSVRCSRVKRNVHAANSSTLSWYSVVGPWVTLGVEDEEKQLTSTSELRSSVLLSGGKHYELSNPSG